MTIKEHKEAKKQFAERFKLTYKNAPKLVRYSAGELTISEIKSVLERLKTQDFVPRILIVDYMDLLCTEKYNNDFRNSQFEIWKGMRGLAQSTNCLVVTATQANGASYTKELLDETNFSEDKRKNGLVTALFGLNQSPQEKELGIMRINTILAREGYFDKRKTVSVLQCLQIGQPVLGSFDS